jgi:hypothetical protein
MLKRLENLMVNISIDTDPRLQEAASPQVLVGRSSSTLKLRMFVRFVIHKNDEDSGRRQGLFHAMTELKELGVLHLHEQEHYDEIYEWFRKNLRKPRSFTRSSKPHAKNVALSWFRHDAAEHIQECERS